MISAIYLYYQHDYAMSMLGVLAHTETLSPLHEQIY